MPDDYLIHKQPPEMFYKKVLLKVSQNSSENTLARVSFFNKVAGFSTERL